MTSDLVGAPSRVRCPKCGSVSTPDRPKWTWWGGLIGPFVFRSLVRCFNCRTTFNVNTGERSDVPIIITVASAVLFVVLVFALTAAI